MWPTEPMEQVQVVLTNDGHPMDAEVELWLGPDTPCKVKVKSEHGKHYAFSAVLETQPGSNTIAVNNNGQEEHPFAASVAADNGASPQPAACPLREHPGVPPPREQPDVPPLPARVASAPYHAWWW